METLLASSVSTPDVGRVFVQEVISHIFLKTLERLNVMEFCFQLITYSR